MIRLLRHDIKRVLLSPLLWVTVLLFFGLGILQEFTSVSAGNPFTIPKKNIEHIGALNRYLLSVCSPNKETIEFALPILMMLPCGTLFLSEYKSRYIRSVLSRSCKGYYIASKMITAFVMGVFTVLAGEVLLLVFNAVIDPHASKAILDPYGGAGRFADMYSASVPGFSLFQSANLMLFGGVYSVFALGFSALWNNKYLTCTTGFLFANIVLTELKKLVETPYATACAKPWYLDVYRTPYTDVLIQYACIVGVSVVVFTVCVLRRCHSDV